MKVSATNSRLFRMKAVSREAVPSSVPGACSRSLRQAIRARVASVMSATKPSSNGPTEPSVNACTESRTPERVRNVPNRVSRNVPTMRDRFHVFSIPRRSCTIDECRNAVATSHGRKDAFSTGSQAQ